MRRILEDACVAGAEDCLVRGLRVILNQGGDNLTNADVVDVVKIIQQRTKKKSSNQEVFKFQDVSILLWVSLLLLSSSLKGLF